MAILLVISRKFYSLVNIEGSKFSLFLFDHMTNIEIINEITKKSSYHARTFSYSHGFITKENFYKFHGKNQKQSSVVFQ